MCSKYTILFGTLFQLVTLLVHLQALAHSFQAIGVQDHFPPQGQGTGTNTASDQRGDRGGDATGQEVLAVV